MSFACWPVSARLSRSCTRWLLDVALILLVALSTMIWSRRPQAVGGGDNFDFLAPAEAVFVPSQTQKKSAATIETRADRNIRRCAAENTGGALILGGLPSSFFWETMCSASNQPIAGSFTIDDFTRIYCLPSGWLHCFTYDLFSIPGASPGACDNSLLGTLGNGPNNLLLDTPRSLPRPLKINTNGRNGRPAFDTALLPEELPGQLWQSEAPDVLRAGDRKRWSSGWKRSICSTIRSSLSDGGRRARKRSKLWADRECQRAPLATGPRQMRFLTSSVAPVVSAQFFWRKHQCRSMRG